MRRAPLLRLLLVAVLALLVAGCVRGPDGAQVREAVQQQLDAALGGRVLVVDSAKLAGSADLREGDGRLIYYNARLSLVRDYDFTQWSAHSVTSLAALLGAGPKGIVGIKPDGNRAGDAIGVYGSAAFAGSGGRWSLLSRAPSAAPTEPPLPAAATVAAIQPRPKELPPPTALEQSLAQFAALASHDAGSGVSEGERERILREEVERAYHASRQRLERAQNLIVVAGGPAGGAYEDVTRALMARAQRAGVLLDSATTEGSIGNLRLLAGRSADFALVQNDVARSALLGLGRFAGAPQPELRAVASLFPEAVQLVASAKSGITGVADLRDKRVELGPQGSGTRGDALAILAANGVTVESLADAGDRPLAEAASQLEAGRIDALFATIHAPAAELQRAAQRMPLAWVPIGPSRTLLDAGLVPLTLPARTYPRQDAPVPTVAAIALLVTRADVPARQVEAVLQLLFAGKSGSDPASVAQIAIRSAREGVNIPWSPAADAWLVARGAPAVASSEAAAAAVPPPRPGAKP